ncbi:MAG: hypothetical protein K8S99_18440 [Planctomycetes bacterium]|nr:hypothetical protein [Planctomycetota bacterium]
MDDRWLSAYEAALVDMFEGRDYRDVGYITHAAVRRIDSSSLEISWYPNCHDRFHEVLVLLPREAFVTCVNCRTSSEKTRIFVKSPWLSRLHLRPYSAFALVDAIEVKAALANGLLRSNSLMQLRSRIDAIAATSPGIAFVSFADTLLLKSNWFVGQYDSNIAYSYEPESLVQLIPKIADAFQSELNLKVYAVVTQGVNEYHDKSLLHISDTRNHVSLNSLGLPFAQLQAIERAAREAIRTRLCLKTRS